MEFCDAIFIVTEERQCPIYNVGEEFRVARDLLTGPEVKPACLILVRQILRITTGQSALQHSSVFGQQKTKFECGGCSGLIRFEFKKEKEYATTQMKLLAAADKRKSHHELEKFKDLLQCFPVFAPLSDNDLYDLFTLLSFRKFKADEIILRQGDPGKNLFIILSGKVAVIDESGKTISELGPGGVLGEMSLLTGTPVTTSVYAREETLLATLTSKDFKHVLHRYPVLHVFFYRLLIDRAGKESKKLETDINLGLSGDVSEIHVVELFQLINSSQKTGTVRFKLVDDVAEVLFNEGEVIHARYGDLMDRKAFFALLGVSSGQFTYSPGIPPAAQRYAVIGGFMGLVMEGMQLLDEEDETLRPEEGSDIYL